MIDLQAIDALYECKNREEWTAVVGRDTAAIESLTGTVCAYGDIDPDDAKLIVAFYNAWPAIREELQCGRRLAEAVKEDARYVHGDEYGENVIPADDILVALREYEEGV